jgi:hypothetical protein
MAFGCRHGGLADAEHREALGAEREEAQPGHGVPRRLGAYESAPKTGSSANTIGLDSDTVAVLRAHRARQEVERRE